MDTIKILIWMILMVRATVALNPIEIGAKEMTVNIGRSVEITRDDLIINRVNLSDPCKVKMISTEPIYQRGGIFEPAVFDCDFRQGSLTYEHLGSPLLTRDLVKFRIYLFASNGTVESSFVLTFVVQNIPYSLVSVKKNIRVKKFYGISDPIDASVIELKTGPRKNGCRAKVSHFQSDWPSNGQLIYGRERERVDVLKLRCEPFLLSALRYEHLKPPSPNKDFVVILFEDRSGKQIVREWVYVSVKIEPAFPNLQPKPSFVSRLLLEVTQNLLAPVTSDVLSARDEETSSENLIFNVTDRDTSYGNFVHLSDRSQPVFSFRQIDIEKFDIAYQPRLKGDRNSSYEIHLVILDGEYLASDRVTLRVVTKPSSTLILRASVVKSLILLEGQSSVIDESNLELINPGSSPVKINVNGGLKHGQLSIRDVTALSFTSKDLANGIVVYKHDGSETERDVVHFRVFDDKISVQCKLPITILPVDDDAPVLIVNKEIEVENGTHFELDGNYLKSVDKDTPEDELVFAIVENPRLGQLVKGLSSQRELRSLVNFTQKDVDNGLVHYNHNGIELGRDTFKFVLEDANTPPNRSPTYFFNIRVVKTDNRIPPAKELSTSLSLSTPEDQVGYFDRGSLHYQCVSCRPRDIVYMVKNAPHVTDSLRINEGGRIVAADSSLSLEENRALPELFSFTQEQVNHGKVGYVPPNSEIGIYPLKIRFTFAVTRNGEKPPFAQEERFNIIVLPVNNQPPVLLLNALTTEEGSRTIISSSDISLYDQDTPESELQLSILTVPLHGSLLRKDRVLRVGDLVYTEEIAKLQLQYVHDGTETLEDQIVFALSDGKHFASSALKISIRAIDDEQPKWLNDLKNLLEVRENSWVLVSDEYLAAKDVDTNYDDIIFILTLEPNHGWFTENDKRVTRFTQKSVGLGLINYVHNGLEIGPRSIADQATFIVSDRAVPYMTTEQSVLKLRIEIIPVDNRAPKMSVRGSLAVEEGGNVILSDEVVSVIDEDTYPENVTCLVLKQPVLGFLINVRMSGKADRPNKTEETEIRDDGPLERFSTYDLVNRRIVYVQSNHSGFEPEYDHFQIMASDGVNNSSVTTYAVTIVLVPDEPPLTTINNVITLNEGAMAMIHSDILSVTDRDFPSDTVLVSVASPPRFGAIVVMTRSRTSMTPLEGVLPIDTFNVRAFYKHDDSENFKDSFDLTIDDGVFKRIETMKVVITPLDDLPPILIRNYPIIMKSNDTDPGDAQVILSSSYLLAVDDDTPASRLTFRVTPGTVNYGVLVLEGHSTLRFPVTEFTQEDVHSNLVRYLRTNYTSGKEEMEFVVSDGLRDTLPATFQILFEPEFNVTYPETPNPKSTTITVLAGGYVILNEDILKIDEQFKELETLKFKLTKIPNYGQIESIKNPGVAIPDFAYWDLVYAKIAYNQSRQLLSGNSTDTFEVIVKLQDQQLAQIRVFVKILANINDSELTERLQLGGKKGHNGHKFGDELFSGEIQDLDNGHKGFVIKHRFKTGHDFSDKIFVISNGPINGDIRLRKEGYVIADSFNLEQISSHDVAYVPSKDGFTDDSVEVRDQNGTNYGIEFAWSVLHFSKLYFEACENDGNVAIEISRRGPMGDVAFVTVETRARTAEMTKDFKPGTTPQIQFDIGIKSVDWILQLINDDQLETNVEQLTLTLTNSVNAFLAYPDTAIVNIYDSNHERCVKNASSSLNQVTDHSINPFLNQVCDEINYGLLQFTENSTQFIRCNGKSWLPWQQNQIEISPTCEKGWRKFGETCFKWSKHFLTWSMAQFVCQNQMKGELVTVQSPDHQAWLNKLAKRPYWIGLYIPKGSVEWSYGNSTTSRGYTNFKEGMKLSKRRLQNRCAVAKRDGIWIARNCQTNSQTYVCQKSPKLIN